MISPTTGGYAKSNSPQTWTDFESALWYADKYRMDGLAFVLTEGIVFVDIDEYQNKSIQVNLFPIYLFVELLQVNSHDGKTRQNIQVFRR